MDNLGNVLTLMCVVIVGGCLIWGAVARVVARRRLAAIRREFHIVPDEQLLIGLAELRRAVLLHDRGESR